jgi:hypothetical protein
MSTSNNDNGNNNIAAILPIRAVSGGERGNKEAGKKYDYQIPKVIFMELIGEVFDKEVERSNKENAKSGGAVSQFLHSYGATADKMVSAVIDTFPGVGQTFDGDCVEKWLELMEFKAPRNGGNRKSAKEVKMETILTTLSIPGIHWSMLSSAYPDVTEADLEAYKAKLAEKAGE